ncbi:MAG: energy-coupling factor transporter transmembrane protein EcfT [Chloroflexi bacterium]|nr:energy-coupling factor transporter transmembrane protein EcfT [Chloroflexota bacterium]
MSCCETTIGQYIPINSFIHRLDPRAKLVAATFIILATTFSRSVVQALFALLIIMLIVKLSKVPFSYVFRGLILALPVLVMIFALQILFRGWDEPVGKIYFQWRFIRLTRSSIQLMSVGLLRVIGLLFIASLVTMTSTTTELTHGVERLLAPLRPLRVPSHELALVLMIALRFVPTFAEEMERIMKVQASRCAPPFERKFWRPDKAARAYLPIVVPLFITAFRRAEELILAMEARGYIGGDGRTKFIQLKSSPRDYLVAAVGIGFFMLMIWAPWPNFLEIMDVIGFGGIL